MRRRSAEPNRQPTRERQRRRCVLTGISRAAALSTIARFDPIY